MGLMYWQINDIWQGTTWSTIEYGLKWKMSHYYVRHMYEPVYPLAILDPYLANITDENAQISIYIINELLNLTHGELICSIHTLDTFSIRSSFSFDISFHSSTVQHIIDLPYASLMKHMDCSMNHDHCIFQCSLNYTDQEIKQTLFLTQPKSYKLYQPHLRIQSIQQLTLTDYSITITAARPALFVWLEIPEDRSGYFSQNGFHMFEPLITISFHSWTPSTDDDKTNLNFELSSLFDVTQR
jgi:beta-mannosidase